MFYVVCCWMAHNTRILHSQKISVYSLIHMSQKVLFRQRVQSSFDPVNLFYKT